MYISNDNGMSFFIWLPWEQRRLKTLKKCVICHFSRKTWNQQYEAINWMKMYGVID